MSAPAMPLRSGSLRWEPFGDGVLVHDAARAEVHLLNQTGALVWEACDGVTPIDEVVAALAQRADHPVDEVAAAVLAHLDALRALGLVDRPPVADPVQWQPGVAVDEPLLAGAVRVLDALVLIRTNADRAVDRVAALLEDLLVDPTPTAGDPLAAPGDIGIGVEPDGRVRLYGRGHDQVFDELGQVDGALVPLVNRVVASSTSPLALHAGAVRSPDGVVVGLAGRSGSGKSTLTGALVRAGWDYLTDEALGVRHGSLQAVGYPKPLSLDARSQALLGMDGAPGDGAEALVPVRRIRGDAVAVTGDAGRLELVVFPTYTPGGQTEGVALEPDDAVVELAGNAINLVPTGQPGLATLVDVARSVPCVRLAHDGLGTAVATIERLVAQVRNP